MKRKIVLVVADDPKLLDYTVQAKLNLTKDQNNLEDMWVYLPMASKERFSIEYCKSGALKFFNQTALLVAYITGLFGVDLNTTLFVVFDPPATPTVMEGLVTTLRGAFGDTAEVSCVQFDQVPKETISDGKLFSMSIDDSQKKFVFEEIPIAA